MKKILENLGGWPAVVGTSWKPPSYPLEVLLGRLRGEYNVGVLVEQWVGPDDKNSSANILQVRRQSKAPSVDGCTTPQHPNEWELSKFDLNFIFFNYKIKFNHIFSIFSSNFSSSRYTLLSSENRL